MIVAQVGILKKITELGSFRVTLAVLLCLGGLENFSSGEN